MIKILVDSASDLAAEKSTYDYFMPIKVNIGGKEYRDGVDLDADTFYNLLVKSEEFPHTSQPSPQDFVEIFEKVKENGDELIYISLSSALSGTYQGAVLAKTMVDYDGIYIVDSKTASHGISVIVKYAARLISEGLEAKEIAEKCQNLVSRVKIFAGVDTLEYLYRGGRLSRTAATVGKIADIKPIVTIAEDGSVAAIGKCLGKGRAMQFILDKVSKFELDSDFEIYSLYTCGEENCAALEGKLEQNGYGVSKRLQVGSTIGAHVGPGVYGVIIVTK
ncbi:MAG: DegV family protein [Oscillospiraceae bacterium]|nr:DegV family protein [Oscillospiraceae bacterium]